MASIKGAAASRSGVTTSTSPGRSRGSAANRPSRWSCSTSSSRLSEWHTCSSMLRSCGVQRQRAGLDRAQFQQRVLQLRQQAVPGGRREVGVVRGAFAAQVDQRFDMRLRLLAPGAEQAVAFLQALGAAARRQVAEAAAVDQVEPVFLARVQHVQVHARASAPARAASAGAAAPWSAAQTHAAPAAARRGAPARGRRAAAPRRRPRPGAARAGQVGLDALPQRGLPGFVAQGVGIAQHVPAGAPGLQPVRPVGDVVLQQGGHLAGQFVAHQIVGAAQVGGQPRVRAPRRRHRRRRACTRQLSRAAA